MLPIPAALPLASVLDDPRDPAGSFHPHDNTSGWDALAQARTRTLDALAGFDKMAEHAEPGFAPIVAAFRDLHQRHGDDLTRSLADAGHATDGDGSVMGTINRVVVATRALFDDIDEDVLAQIHSGERHVVAAYEAALAESLPPAVHDMLRQMLVELNEILADTRPAT